MKLRRASPPKTRGPRLRQERASTRPALGGTRAGKELKSIFEQAPVGIFLSTVQGRLLRVNAAAARMFGYASTEEFVAQATHIPSQLFVFPEQRSRLIDQAMECADFVRAQVDYVRKDGSVFLGHLHMRVVRGPKGQGPLLEGFVEDITERQQAEAALRQSETRLRMLFECARDAILLMHRETFIKCNPATLVMFGCQEQDILGRTPADFSPPLQPDGQDSQVKTAEKIQAALAGLSSSFEWRHRRLDGTEFDAEVSLNRADLNGQPFLQAIVRDITDRKRVEAELRRTNRTLRMLSECNHALVHAVEESQLFQAICHLAVGTGGYRMAWVGLVTPDEARSVRPVAVAGFESGYVQSAHIALADSERGAGPVGTAIRTGQAVVVRNTLTDPAFAPWREAARQRGYAACAAFPLKQAERMLGALAVYSTEPDTFDREEVALLSELADDIAYGVSALRTRLEHERVGEELHRLSAHLLQVRDEERRRLARDLHDTTAQHLAALSLNLTHLKALLGPSAPRAVALCADSVQLANQSAQEIRMHAYLLHPPLLEALGLVGAVEEYVEGFSARSGIVVELEASADFGRLPEEMELTLFRVVQESLGNVLKHSHSARARIRLMREPSRVKLEIQDRGHGIPAEKLARIQAMSGGCGVGLGGMQERLRLQGGRLEIQSSKAGTTIRALAPLTHPRPPPVAPG